MRLIPVNTLTHKLLIKFSTVTSSIFIVLILINMPTQAAQHHVVPDKIIRVAVLDFELNDITLVPNTPQEVALTATAAPLLEWLLASHSQIEIVNIEDAVQHEANAGFGYLFSHGNVVADLGRKYNADYVIVGQMLKPSYLIQFLDVYIASVKKMGFVGENIRQTIYGGNDQNKILKKASIRLANAIGCTIVPMQDEECLNR